MKIATTGFMLQTRKQAHHSRVLIRICTLQPHKHIDSIATSWATFGRPSILEPKTHTTKHSCFNSVSGSCKSKFKMSTKTKWPCVSYWYWRDGALWRTTTSYGQYCSKSTRTIYPHRFSGKWQNILCEIYCLKFSTSQLKSHSFSNHGSHCM